MNGFDSGLFLRNLLMYLTGAGEYGWIISGTSGGAKVVTPVEHCRYSERNRACTVCQKYVLAYETASSMAGLELPSHATTRLASE